MDIAIRCRDLRKVYDGKPPVEAVRGLDLEVRSGECFGLLGPNGGHRPGNPLGVDSRSGMSRISGGRICCISMAASIPG
jgi:ABC-2 type transport system ATP-binding protein